MISGRASATLLWLALSAAGAASLRSAELDSLLASLVRDPPQTIEFLELRNSALLEEELEIRGTLEYRGSGNLTRTVSTPLSERTDIDGDVIRIQRGNRPERVFSLARAPGLGGFLTGLTSILAGDREALEREFELSLAGAETDWELTLVPRSAEVRARLEAIRLHGAGSTPLCIVTTTKAGATDTVLLLGEAATTSDPARKRAMHCGGLP